MKLLILGGTGFLGYHVVAAALDAGHEVSAFTRQGQAPLAGAEPLWGDRLGNLSALHGRTWDAVLDTFGDPEAVGETARLLAGSAGTHGFVSGTSNYHPDGPPVVDEDAPLRRPGEREDDPLQERSIAKISCEAAVRDGFSGEVLIVRPGIMVGPRDPTDRFSWWPVRFARGGEVLGPGDPDRLAQFTDARDLALWMVRMLDVGLSGTFNAVGPGREVTISEVLDECRRASDGGAGSARTTWVGERFLREQLTEVPEEERPLWFPEDQIPFRTVDSSWALAAGLRFRSAEETARDTLSWVRSRAQDPDLRAGLDPALEIGLLQRWRSRPEKSG